MKVPTHIKVRVVEAVDSVVAELPEPLAGDERAMEERHAVQKPSVLGRGLVEPVLVYVRE